MGGIYRGIYTQMLGADYMESKLRAGASLSWLLLTGAGEIPLDIPQELYGTVKVRGMQ